MAAALKIPDLMTVDEFLVWDAPEGYLWQLVDGAPVAMAPPSVRHGIIQGNMARLIGNHLDGGRSPCQMVITPGVVPRLRSDRNFLIPDIAVTCSPADLTGAMLRAPVLLVEVLSPSRLPSFSIYEYCDAASRYFLEHGLLSIPMPTTLPCFHAGSNDWNGWFTIGQGLYFNPLKILVKNEGMLEDRGVTSIRPNPLNNYRLKPVGSWSRRY